MTAATPPASICSDPTDTLREIEQRVLWLSTAMIHHANRVRPNPVRVEGRRPSGVLRVDGLDHDVAVVRSSCSPATGCRSSPMPRRCCTRINYLLGELDEKYLTTLREFGGLQSYPEPVQGSRSGRLLHRARSASVRRHRSGAPSPAATSTPARSQHRYGAASTRWSATPSWTRARCGRRSSTPSVAELGEIVWIVDLNRQSLDRVVPNIAAGRLEAMFAAAGWQVITVNFGPAARGAVHPAGRRGAAHRIFAHAQPRIPAAAALHARRAARRALPGAGTTAPRSPR